MPVRVLATPRAEQQINALRRKDRGVFDKFTHDLAVNGCGALSYRLTGPSPLDHLCVKHLAHQLRVVVGFTSEDAWILLVGPHDDRDPGIDVYASLYALTGVTPPDTARRTKPPCCTGDGTPPVADDVIDDLARRATQIRRTRRSR